MICCGWRRRCSELLVWRLNRGDTGALAEVYEAYRDDLLRLAASMLSDRAAAEDVVQDVFVKFAGAARTFRLTGSLKGFLATCVANAARKAVSRAFWPRAWPTPPVTRSNRPGGAGRRPWRRWRTCRLRREGRSAG